MMCPKSYGVWRLYHFKLYAENCYWEMLDPGYKKLISSFVFVFWYLYGRKKCWECSYLILFILKTCFPLLITLVYYFLTTEFYWTLFFSLFLLNVPIFFFWRHSYYRTMHVQMKIDLVNRESIGDHQYLQLAFFNNPGKLLFYDIKFYILNLI